MAHMTVYLCSEEALHTGQVLTLTVAWRCEPSAEHFPLIFVKMADQTIEQRVKEIIVNQLNVNEEQITPTASFLDDLAKTARHGRADRGL